MNKDHYIFFGETTLDTMGVTRQGYIGKEKDVENGLGAPWSEEVRLRNRAV